MFTFKADVRGSGLCGGVQQAMLRIGFGCLSAMQLAGTKYAVFQCC
jgi:hypothetical protein